MIKNSEMKTKSKKPKVIAVAGPTASGKTSYSIELASEIGGEIVSADSRLVYKGFDIVCAKPSIAERNGIPHYMMDIVEPEYDYTAGLYVKDARKIIYDILSRGKVPIVVGGTGLYFRLLLENFEPPKVEPDYALREKLKDMSNEDLYSMLADLDSEGVKSIELNDRKKLIRSIEIVQYTGKSLNAAKGLKDETEFDVEWIGRNFPRDILYERINKRVDIMLENGMIDETKHLLEKHGRIQNITDTIGYHELIEYLDGKLSLETALDLLKQNTRRYAKRQLTWFRKNKNIQWNCYPDILKK